MAFPIMLNRVCRANCKTAFPWSAGPSRVYYFFNQNGQRLLILTRKQNESIVIDNAINIVVLQVNGNEVKFGIICPEDTTVRCEDNRKKSGTAPQPR